MSPWTISEHEAALNCMRQTNEHGFAFYHQATIMKTTPEQNMFARQGAFNGVAKNRHAKNHSPREQWRGSSVPSAASFAEEIDNACALRRAAEGGEVTATIDSVFMFAGVASWRPRCGFDGLLYAIPYTGFYLCMHTPIHQRYPPLHRTAWSSIDI